MRWLAQVRFYLRSLFHKRRLDEQLAEEIQGHIDLAAAANVARGMTAEEARDVALREFGNVAGVQEQARDERGGVWLEQWLQDARYSVRALARAPGFALTVWGTLVVGIGLASAIMGLTAPTLFAPQADGLQ